MKRFLLTFLVVASIIFGAFQLLVQTDSYVDAADTLCKKDGGASCHHDGQKCGKDMNCTCKNKFLAGIWCLEPTVPEV